ncbi:MAG: hypothetical protein AB7K78_27270, partial [Xanthobacteraceae bacterium]
MTEDSSAGGERPQADDERIETVAGLGGPKFDAARLQRRAAFAPLRLLSRWVCWRYEFRDGRRTKPPINPRTGAYANTADPSTWATFDEAVARAQTDPSVEGIGFTLVEDDDIYGVDFDHVIDPATGAMLPFAAEIVAKGETYCERSPSGTGLRMLARGKLGAAIKEDAANVEAYECWRYMTVTGDKLDGAPDEIREAPQTLMLLRKRVEEVRARRPPTKAKANGAHYSGGDEYNELDTAALQNLGAWVRDLFGDKVKKTVRGYRIPSAALGRDLQEDLSITPEGIVDFGVADMGDPTEGKRTPVTLIMEHRKCS